MRSKIYRGFFLLPLLGGCSRETPPCQTVVQAHESVILAATIITPNGPPESYQLEFTSMQACDAARQELRAEMDSAIGRARNDDLNMRPSEQGWTDYRGIYRAIRVASTVGHGYPDLVAACADHGLAPAHIDQSGSGAAQSPDGSMGTAGTGASLPAEQVITQPGRAAIVPIQIVPVAPPTIITRVVSK